MFNWPLSTLVLVINLLSNRLVTFTQNLQSPVAPALSGAQVFASEEHHKMFSIGPYQGMKNHEDHGHYGMDFMFKRNGGEAGCFWMYGILEDGRSVVSKRGNQPQQLKACTLSFAFWSSAKSGRSSPCQDQQAHMPKRFMLSSDERSKPLFGDQFVPLI